MGIALIPSAEVPDPGIPEDLLVPVLPGLVGRERPVRISVPAALAEVPKIKQVLKHINQWTDGRAPSQSATSTALQKKNNSHSLGSPFL
jgi:hypothetical protein